MKTKKGTAKINFLRNKKGQAMVEFLFTFVLIVILFIGLVNLSLVSYSWVVLQYAASEGSRFGSIGILDPGYVSRETNIRDRVLAITNAYGVGDVDVTFLDQAGGNTAGAASEFFKMELTRDVQFLGIPNFFGAGIGGLNPHYQLITWTVIRNEPF